MAHGQVSISFNCIILIQSLEPHEQYTTLAVQEGITGNVNFAADPIPVNRYHVNSAIEFVDLIASLTSLAKGGLKPIVNVDCHGDMLEGLEFENGSTLGWTELSECLVPLNAATEFNLIAVFSACYGAYFLQSMGPIKPSPFAFLLAPSEEVEPSELMGTLRTFYNSLFDSMNMIDTVRSLYAHGLRNGIWFAEFAEVWYVQAVTLYVENYCTKKQSRIRVQQAIDKLKSEGFVKGSSLNLASRLKQDLLRQHNTTFTNRYFNTYFMIDAVPSNRERFGYLKSMIDGKLAELKATKKYLL